MAAVVAEQTSVIEAVVPELTLYGLRIVWERFRAKMSQ